MNRLAMLYEQLVDGRLDAGGQAELAEFLADPAARRAVAEWWRLDGALTERLRPTRLESQQALVVAVRARQRPQARRLPQRWVLITAAALLLTTMAWIVFANKGMTAPSQAVVAVGPQELVLPAGHRLRLAEGSRLQVATAPHLEVGEVVVQAAGPLVLTTAHGTVEVLGTTFTLTVDAATTVCAVASGRVRLASITGSTHELGPGDRATLSASGGLELAPPSASWGWDGPGTPLPEAAWLGQLTETGLAPQLTRKSAELAYCEWTVTAEGSPFADRAALDAVVIYLSVPSPELVVVLIGCYDGNGLWQANLQSDVQVAAGTHRLVVPVAKMTAIAGRLPQDGRPSLIRLVHVGLSQQATEARLTGIWLTSTSAVYGP